MNKKISLVGLWDWSLPVQFIHEKNICVNLKIENDHDNGNGNSYHNVEKVNGHLEYNVHQVLPFVIFLPWTIKYIS